VDVAIKILESGRDDISTPGQCLVALALCSGLKDREKASYLEPEAGHQGIFSGKSWRNKIRPRILEFIDTNS
jgi:poly(3-hydroxybutyrate) depolymerase